MTTDIVAQDEEQAPLLQDFTNSARGDEEGVGPASSNGPESPIPVQRLVSLDVFRGLTIALMILVDDAGGDIPSINHSPWFGVTLADFVMPFFLFGVGISICLAFKKISSKSTATMKVILRFIKLFLLGILLQGIFLSILFIRRVTTIQNPATLLVPLANYGGYFHGRHHLTYGVDVSKMRFLGVLQRISIGYLLASMSEIWLVNNVIVDSSMTFVRKYYSLWMVAVSLCILYVCLLHGLYVPDWEFEVSTSNLTLHGSGTQTVHCGLRGNLEPPCNAVGLIDRILLGEDHFYQRSVYRRTKECSVNTPDYGPLPQNSPAWCLAPFDPEGILSSMMAAITCFVGLHFGHVLLHFKDNMHRVFLWSFSSFPLLISGYALKLLGIPFCKPLYTLSYMCVTAGVSGLGLTAVFYIVDVKNLRKPTILLQWMGMNALIIYALAACDIFPAAVQGVYWRSPENNLVDGTESLLQAMLHSQKWGTLVFVFLEIIFWGFIAGVLHMKGIYIKL